MTINEKLFEEQRRPRFGNANPERMEVAFWEWMIRGGASFLETSSAARDESSPLADSGEGGIGSWPWDARRFFKMESGPCDGPIWTFHRYGATRTELPDGRVVCIGGEHEDYYDPDFHIYNDVVVLGLAGQVEIFGYPKEIFPPTDFHTATLLENSVIVIGSLGYPDERNVGRTPVYSLDLANYSISNIKTSGDAPGWISEHKVQIGPRGIISVRDGKVIEEHNGEQRYRRNFDDFELDVSLGIWRRTTNRKRQQFSIRQQDKKLFLLERDVSPQNLVPGGIISELPEEDGHRKARTVIDGVPVLLICGISEIEVIIEGDLSGEAATKIVEQLRVNAEVSVKRPCVAERL